MDRSADTSPGHARPVEAGDSSFTIFIVADDPARRSTVGRQLTSMNYAVEAFASVDDYRAGVNARRCGCIVIDAPSCAAGEALESFVNNDGLPRPIVYITDDRDVPVVVRAMRRGAVDVLPRRSYTESDLWDAIQAAQKRDAANRDVFRKRQDCLQRVALLTEHERRVLQLLVQGMSNPEIAAECGVSRVAVEGRRARMMKKIGVTNLPALVRFAIEAGLDGDGDGRLRSKM